MPSQVLDALMSHVMGQSQSGTEVKDEFKKSRSQQQEPAISVDGVESGRSAPSPAVSWTTERALKALSLRFALLRFWFRSQQDAKTDRQREGSCVAAPHEKHKATQQTRSEVSWLQRRKLHRDGTEPASRKVS